MRTRSIPTTRLRPVAAAAALTLCLALATFGAPRPALAASADACYAAPSNATCDGASVDVNALAGDPCFADSYSITYEDNAPGANFTYSDEGWSFETWLDYSPACQSNFTYTEVTHIGPLPYHVANKVRRAGGADGPYLLEQSGWYYPALYQSWASPLVYSPDDAVQACLSTNANNQVQCTTGGPNGNGYY